MRWEQTEFLLKGIYLGLLVVVALDSPTWQEVAQVFLYMAAGLVLCLGVAAVRKLREGYRIRGRFTGFILFLLLENPGMVYAGVILGLCLGTYRVAKPENPEEQNWNLVVPVIGGALLGTLFYFMRHVRERKIRLWLGLAMAVLLVGGTGALLHYHPEAIPQREMLGYLLLLGIPGFYLLTFASLVEESEVEIAAICAALGVSMWLLSTNQFGLVGLILPLGIYYVYTRRILPGLRVFKHALRGLSYAMVGQYRPALGSLNRALQLNPGHTLAREQLWYVHRQMDVDQLKNDPETLALVNYELCLERVSWLLLLDKPKIEHLQEAERLLDLVSSQKPALEPICAYWRAVAFLHRRQYDEAARNLESVLAPNSPPEGAKDTRDSPQRRSILFSAWQLAMVLHPEMTRRVATPVLAQPGRRMEAIAAVERRLALKTEDSEAWDLKRLLYSDLTEAEYHAGVGVENVAKDFDHTYTQQMGLALIDNPQRWQRGCEYLRLAARGLATEAPSIYLEIGKVHEKNGDKTGPWRYCQLAMQSAKAVGVANLKPEDAQKLFAIVKQLGEEAMAQGRIDDALEAFKFYSQNEKAGLENYRTLAELFERKADVWMALHCTEHALSYDATDKDLLARKDRYYFSIQPEEVKPRWDKVAKWFDDAYCVEKSRKLLERFNGDLDLLDWAGHLAELAQVAKPSSITAKFLRARVRRQRGEIAEAVALLEEIRQNKPEKFATNDEEESWYFAHRMLGELYLEEKPDQAVLCLQEFRKCEKSGANTMYKLGQAYENLGDFARAARCYEQVTAFQDHPLYYEAQAGLERVKRNPVS
jgi:tetratricopeptide (TPR) repeat protein